MARFAGASLFAARCCFRRTKWAGVVGLWVDGWGERGIVLRIRRGVGGGFAGIGAVVCGRRGVDLGGNCGVWGGRFFRGPQTAEVRAVNVVSAEEMMQMSVFCCAVKSRRETHKAGPRYSE
jgi:hypothetical protein